MTARSTALITYGGAALILAAGTAAIVLNMIHGEAIFAAKLIAGFTGCL